MRLYLLRHGIAEEWRPDLPDEKRRLTAEGKRKVRMIAQGLSKIGLELDLIVTSPLPRAQETAEIAAEILGLSDRLKEDEGLASGFGLATVQNIAANSPDAQNIMLVGHEPGFSMLASALTGGSQIDLKKGGLIRIDLDKIAAGAGVLKWVLAPCFFFKE